MDIILISMFFFKNMLQTDFKFDLRLMTNHPFFEWNRGKILIAYATSLLHMQPHICIAPDSREIRVEFDLVWCSTRVQRVDVLNGAYRSSIKKEADQQYIVSYIKLVY